MENNLIEFYSQKLGITTDRLLGIYNPEQKFQFVVDDYGHQADRSQRAIVDLLCKTGVIEQKYNKDLNQFNIVDLEELFRYLHAFNVSSFYNRKTNIKSYFLWCINKRLIDLKSLNVFDNFTIDSIPLTDRIKSEYFKDINDLKKGIDTLTSTLISYDKLYDAHQYDVCVATLFLTWCGLNPDDITNLETDSIDLDNKRIKYNNKNIIIPEEMIEFFTEYNKSSGYSNKTKGGYFKVYSYKKTKYFLKRLFNNAGEQFSQNTLAVKITHFEKLFESLPNDNRYADHLCNFASIQRNGYFYRTFLFEQKYHASISNVDKDVLNEIMYRDTMSDSMRNNFIINYQNWKRIFYGI